MEALLSSYERPLAGSLDKAVNRAMLEEELANINRMLLDVCDSSDKLEVAFTLPKKGAKTLRSSRLRISESCFRRGRNSVPTRPFPSGWPHSKAQP